MFLFTECLALSKWLEYKAFHVRHFKLAMELELLLVPDALSFSPETIVF